MYPNDPYFSGPPMMSAPPTPRRTNTVATWSLVFAFVFASAGAVLGHLSLAQIKRTGEQGRDRALIGVILSYVVILMTVVALTIWGFTARRSEAPSTPTATATATATTAATTTSPVSVSRTQLPSLLLSLDEIRGVISAPNNYTTTDAQALNESTDMDISPPQCPTVMISGASEIYGPSGTVATASRTLNGVRPVKSTGVVMLEERVTLYENDEAAAGLVESMAGVWQDCAGVLMVQHADGSGAQQFDIGQTTHSAADPSMILLTDTLAGSPTYNVRAVVAKANVVVDISVLGPGVGDDAEILAAAVAARIGALR